MTAINFIKMHHCGNDFVIVDEQKSPAIKNFSRQDLQCIADRKIGIGCDQIVAIHYTSLPSSLCVTFYNQDGSKVGVCGNALICIGKMIAIDRLTVKTHSRQFHIEHDANLGVTSVNMGAPSTKWHEIPLSHEKEFITVSLEKREFIGFPVSMGNPHVIFFHEDISQVSQIARILHKSDALPNGANVSIAKQLAPSRYLARTYERGVGETEACGSAACAIAYLAFTKRDSEHSEIITIEWERYGSMSVTMNHGEMIIHGSPEKIAEGTYLSRALGAK